ncbi:MAG: cupin domain-containing protein [Rhodanobacter sp.]
MQLNADFSQRVAVHAATLDWVPSPVAGIDRRMLDRIGGEVARATSIVRYAPNSHFSPHTHGGGEEFLVLDGVFQDETGDFPAGSYVRNPPQSRHAPGSASGCTIFVKLWQFDPLDRTPLRRHPSALEFTPEELRAGVAVKPLFRDVCEEVRLEHWGPHTRVRWPVLPGGGEILVVDGVFHESNEHFGRLSWLRLPPGAALDAHAGRDGCQLWVKTGHLARPSSPPTGGGAC